MITDDPRSVLRAAILNDGLMKAVFAGACRGARLPWVRITIRPVEIRGERTLQFVYFDGTKTETQNPSDVAATLRPIFDAVYSGVHIDMATETIDVRTTKKGQTSLSRKPTTRTPTAPAPHNRIKDQPLPEGRADSLLAIMGIASADGVVKPTMRGKFTQINEFLRQLKSCLEPAGLLDLGRPMRVLDCGCGSSYLTIAAHHYLNDVLKLPAELIGVDLNQDVIRKSLDRKSKLGAAELNFACERIGAADIPADVVFALHACNTATDDALAQGVRSQARLILSVPCCHHDLNAKFKEAQPPPAWMAAFRHGILRERTADLVTDAFRVAALRIAGYRTEAIEFISPEHTARNLMIRAVHTGQVDPAAIAEFAAMKEYWNVEPAIGQRLAVVLGQSWPSSPS